MNPILNQLMGNNNNFIDLYKTVRASQDPNSLIQTLMKNNPKIQQVMAFIGQNGGNAKQAFYTLANQKNVDPNVIINNLKNL